MGVFGAQVNVALAGTHREPGDEHAFDEAEGVAFKQHAVGKSAGIAFVRVAHHVLLVAGGGQHGLPLDTGRKGRTAPTAQARLGDGRDDLAGRERQRRPEPRETAMGSVVIQGQRIGDADAGKGEPLLLLPDRESRR
jgi:hypothetical protein